MHIHHSSWLNKNIAFALLTFLVSLPVFSTSVFQVDSVKTSEDLTHEELVRGERLFHGLIYLENKAMNCSACHVTVAAAEADSMNWSPDALEISLKYREKSIDEFSRVLLSPGGQKMAAAHAAFKLSPDEVRYLKGYLDRFPEKGLKPQKPVIVRLLLFIFAALLFLGALTDLIFTKKLRPVINLAILAVTTGYITWELVINAILIGRSPGYSPDQPIKFSHAIHAGQNGTECVYCHNFAPVSKVSGFPSQNVCMNCHLLVRTGKRSGTHEIAKVIESYETRQPIRWIQVHNLPDHAYFNHSQHVGAGGIDCTECHGPVKEMDRIVQVSDLSMGWCVNCHRTRKVNFEGNEFYAEYELLAEKVRNGTLDSVNVDLQGGNGCMRCHY